MSEVDFLNDAIAERFGFVRRARGPFLYTQKGVRLTDLYRDAGRAVLGWGGTGAFTMFKNVLSRGLTGSFPTCFSGRLLKAVETLLDSKRKIFVFNDRQKALSAAVVISSEGTFFWKPWIPEGVVWSSADCVIVELPLAWTPGIFILAVLDNEKNEAALAGLALSSVRISAAVEAACARSIYDIILAVQSKSEKDWFIYDTVLTKYWERRGPYLYPKVPKEKYREFAEHCLDCAVVVSPFYDVPGIVPFGADPGVFSALKKKPFVMEKI